ncbi:hypothetical protein MKX01_022605 [Papaver californicum]|nr:hypothetical protein MKX01_022605 [Papaver californicum]
MVRASGKAAEKMNLLTLQHKMKIDPGGCQQSALSFSSINGNPTIVSKDLGDMAKFLAHVTPYYPTHLSDYPCKFADWLRSSAKSLPSLLSCHLTKALSLLVNRKFELRKDAFSHVIHSIRKKHKNGTQNSELKAKRAVIVFCDLNRRRVWFELFDERTVNAICTACFHPSSKIMNIEDAVEDSDTDSSEDEKNPQAVLQRGDVYKAHHKEVFSLLQTCNEQFEMRMMMLKVIVRTVGLHRLILLSFYPSLQRYTVVNQFVHDKSRIEEIAVGLNAVREICLHIPLLMTKRLLYDLVLYRKSHEKALCTAARSLITLFKEVCSSWLVKKDRGRPTNPKARPKAFREVNIASNVSGLGLTNVKGSSIYVWAEFQTLVVLPCLNLSSFSFIYLPCTACQSHFTVFKVEIGQHHELLDRLPYANLIQRGSHQNRVQCQCQRCINNQRKEMKRVVNS